MLTVHIMHIAQYQLQQQGASWCSLFSQAWKEKSVKGVGNNSFKIVFSKFYTGMGKKDVFNATSRFPVVMLISHINEYQRKMSNF